MTSEWEKEFDEKFPLMMSLPIGERNLRTIYNKAVKKFIHTLLTSQRKTIDRCNQVIGDMADETEQLLAKQRREFVEKIEMLVLKYSEDTLHSQNLVEIIQSLEQGDKDKT